MTSSRDPETLPAGPAREDVVKIVIANNSIINKNKSCHMQKISVYIEITSSNFTPPPHFTP